LGYIPIVAKAMGLNISAGAWLGSDFEANNKEIESLITIAQAGLADVCVVGNEVLLRGDLSESQLIEYINHVKTAVPGVPVTTAEVYNVLLRHPAVISACDIVYINIYPFWEGIAIDRAVAFIHEKYKEVKKAVGNKQIVVAETGWPSDGEIVGEAVPGLENACRYFLNFVSWAKAQDINYFYFEAFDEPWKAGYEGPQGSSWGIWNESGTLKSCMQRVFDGETVPDNWSKEGFLPGQLGIEFTYVPPYGSFEDLSGKVTGVKPADYRVAVYIYVEGWWNKPY